MSASTTEKKSTSTEIDPKGEDMTLTKQRADKKAELAAQKKSRGEFIPSAKELEQHEAKMAEYGFERVDPDEGEDWHKLIADAQAENVITTLGIGQWFHDEPCSVPDGAKAGLTKGLDFLGVEARYNTRSSRAEIRHESFPEGWRTMNDRLAAEIREVLSKRFEYEKREGVKKPLKFDSLVKSLCRSN